MGSKDAGDRNVGGMLRQDDIVGVVYMPAERRRRLQVADDEASNYSAASVFIGDGGAAAPANDDEAIDGDGDDVGAGVAVVAAAHGQVAPNSDEVEVAHGAHPARDGAPDDEEQPQPREPAKMRRARALLADVPMEVQDEVIAVSAAVPRQHHEVRRAKIFIGRVLDAATIVADNTRARTSACGPRFTELRRAVFELVKGEGADGADLDLVYTFLDRVRVVGDAERLAQTTQLLRLAARDLPGQEDDEYIQARDAHARALGVQLHALQRRMVSNTLPRAHFRTLTKGGGAKGREDGSAMQIALGAGRHRSAHLRATRRSCRRSRPTCCGRGRA